MGWKETVAPCGAELRSWLRRQSPIRCNEPAGHVDPYDANGMHRSSHPSGGWISWSTVWSLPVPLDGEMMRQPAEWVLGGRCKASCCREAQPWISKQMLTVGGMVGPKWKCYYHTLAR